MAGLNAADRRAAALRALAASAERRQFAVIADAPDDRPGVIIGPLYSDEAVVELAKELAEAGWKGTGVRVYLSRAAWRDLAREAEASGG